MSMIQSDLLLGQEGGGGGYTIERSLRFNSSDSAYLSRTPASAGNRKTWTWAGWVKRSKLAVSDFELFSAGGTDQIRFSDDNGGNSIRIITASGNIITSQLFRDTSSWYHIVVAVDTSQGVSSDRIKLFINGVQVSAFFSPTYPALNADTGFNSSTAHNIGALTGNYGFFDGYLADIHFIDGQALTPSSFGEFDTNNVWQPKAYSGSGYGTNGFRLDFSDNSAATATTLGKDTSGNSNNWTPNNLSVTAGAGNDSLVDSPTNYGTDTGVGGEVRGNYCTWNPLVKTNQTLPSLANGNLDVGGNTSGGTVLGTIGFYSGKWYWEISVSSIGTALIGAASTSAVWSSQPGYIANSAAYLSDGRVKNNGSDVGTYSSYTTGDIIGVALNMDAGELKFYKNGSLIVTINSSISGTWLPAVADWNASGSVLTTNFGQRPFAYTAPSGFKALCTANLPSETITTSGSYTGNGVADGPFVYLNGVPTAMTVGGNAVTFGTHADKLSNGFKIRTTSTTYNQNALTYNYTITTTGDPFKRARAQANP